MVMRMKIYFVNKEAQENGDHEVHHAACDWLPYPEKQHLLGRFATCKEAVAEAKKIYPTADGCYYCSNACHKR